MIKIAVNKVTYKGSTLIDLTADTVTADSLLTGKKAHGKNGALVTGTCSFDSNTTDATATADEILTGKTAYIKKTKVAGSMPNKGAVTANVNAGGSYTIPKGYHDGSGKVTGNSLASQTSADAAAGDVLKNKTAWVNGSKITGSMPNNGAVSPSELNAGGSYTIPAGYHDGNGKVAAKSLADQTSADATAANILSGKTAWVNGSKITGTMKNNTDTSTVIISNGGSYLASGYYGGFGKQISTPTLASQTSADAVAADILSGKTAWVNGVKLTGSLTGATVGLTAEKLVEGTTILGVTGTAKVGEGRHLVTNQMVSGGRKDIPVYSINAGANQTKPYILLSDLISKYNDFHFMKIVTQYSYTNTTSGAIITQYDLLLLTSDTYPSGATDVTVMGNRTEGINLGSTMIYYAGTNTTILDAQHALKNLSYYRGSGSTLTVNSNFNQIAICLQTSNVNAINIDVYIV